MAAPISVSQPGNNFELRAISGCFPILQGYWPLPGMGHLTCTPQQECLARFGDVVPVIGRDEYIGTVENTIAKFFNLLGLYTFRNILVPTDPLYLTDATRFLVHASQENFLMQSVALERQGGPTCPEFQERRGGSGICVCMSRLSSVEAQLST